VTVRIGVLGVGRIGKMHAEIIATKVPETSLAGVFDVNDAAAQAVSEELRAPVMTVEEMLASPDVDAVAVCSSTDTHVDLIERAAAAGKAIFCEKPVSLDLSEVDRALAAVDAAKRSLHGRLQPPVRPHSRRCPASRGARPSG